MRRPPQVKSRISKARVSFLTIGIGCLRFYFVFVNLGTLLHDRQSEVIAVAASVADLEVVPVDHDDCAVTERESRWIMRGEIKMRIPV